MTLKNHPMSWGMHSYETPSVTVLDVQVEGVLCESLINSDPDSWKPGQDNWFE